MKFAMRLALLCHLSLISHTVLAGPSISGGGGTMQVKFVESARYVADCFNAHPREASAILGIDSSLFERAVDQTGVVCATGKTQQDMKRNGQEAYYNNNLKKILLSFCDETGRLIWLGPIVELDVVTHEYFRVLGEGDEYRYSSRVRKILNMYCQ